MISIHRYFKLPELRESLRRHVGTSHGGRRVFMLPAHSSDDMLLEVLRTEGSYFGARPEIWSWPEMYRAFVPRDLLKRQVDPPDHRLILKYIVDAALNEMDASGTPVPKAARRSGFIEILSSAIRELLLEGVSPDRLAYGPQSSEGTIAPRELLYRLYTDYLLYLDEHGLADNSQLPSLIMRDMQDTDSGIGEICWIGFMSFTGAQIKLVRALSRYRFDMRFWVPDPCLDDFRDSVEQIVGVTPRDEAGTKCFLSLSISRDTYSQYDDVARTVADSVFDSGDIGIMTAPGRIDRMASALAKYGVPYQTRSEVSVRDTVLVETVRSVWGAYRRGWPVGRTAALLSSPIFGLGALCEEKISARMPEGVVAWREFLSGDEGTLGLFERLNSFCSFLDTQEGHTAEEILRALLDLASEDWVSTVSREAWDADELDGAVRTLASARLEVEQKLELLAELTPPLDEAGSVRFSGTSAVEFISDWSSDASTALPPPLTGAVTIYDAPPSVLVSHDLWIMTDVEPGRFPGAMSDHTLLDGEIRESVNSRDEEFVHLPTLHEKRCQQEALFRRLLCIGESLTVVARSALDVQGRPQESSPFLESVVSDDEPRWEVAGEAVHEAEISNAARSYRGRFPRVATSTRKDEKMRVRASSVDEWYECPYSFWLSNVIGMKTPSAVSELPDRISQGNLVHAIWDDVWRDRASTGRPIHTILLEKWSELTTSHAKKFPFLRDPRAFLALDRIRSDMLAMASIQDDIEARASAEGLRKIETISEAPLPQREMQNIVFAARADRLDVWDGLGVVIMDYKLGRSDAYRNSLQLAVYAAMIRDAGTIDVAGYCYLCHADGKVRGSWADGALKKIYGGYGNDPLGLDGNIAGASSVMQDMDLIIGGGKYSANYESKLCRRCDYSLICRRAERMGAFMPEEEEDDDAS